MPHHLLLALPLLLMIFDDHARVESGKRFFDSDACRALIFVFEVLHLGSVT